jgi:hypothetical protein
MSLARFQADVRLGDPDRIWLGPLRQKHGTEVHTRAEWKGLVETLKAQPVSYENLRRTAALGPRR